ncbi:MAG: hypothetical protein ABIH86_02835 [Planctomycetota bacterium]
MKKIILVFISVIISNVSLLSLEIGDPSRQFQEAAAAIARQDYPSAERLLTELQQEWPTSADVDLFLGIARYHQEKFPAAKANIERAIENNVRYMPRALYYSGLIGGKLDDEQQVNAAFDRLIMEYPESAEAKIIDGILSEMDADASDLSVSESSVDPSDETDGLDEPLESYDIIFSQTTEFGYDSRVASPADLPVDADNEDAFAFASLTLYPFRWGDASYFSADAFTYAYFETSEFNYSGFALSIGRDINRQDDTFGYAVSAASSLFGGSYFDSTVRFDLESPLSASDAIETDILFSISGSKFVDDYKLLDNAQADLSIRWGIDPGESIPLLFVVDIGISRRQARDQTLSYTAGFVNAEMTWFAPAEIDVSFEASYQLRMYDSMTTGYTGDRMDQRATGKIEIVWNATDWLALTIELVETISISEVEDYDYNRETASAGIQIAF